MEAGGAVSTEQAETFFRWHRYRADHIEAMGTLSPTDAGDPERSTHVAEQHILLSAMIESLAQRRYRGKAKGRVQVARLLREWAGPWFQRCSWPSIREVRGLPFEKVASKAVIDRLEDHYIRAVSWSCADDPAITDLHGANGAWKPEDHLYGSLFHAQRSGWLHGGEYVNVSSESGPEYADWKPTLVEPEARPVRRPAFSVPFMLKTYRDVLEEYSKWCRKRQVNPCTGQHYR